ncbi:hypothetical protein CLV62_102131 [Dysgonomonas alginatilytica]|uniref:Uncharacterized protein n=1 Tax=Dysgonomonas alginatilytica TaxID=1605892 RepID=A0A2V3PSV4_9BACT|nr:hypothetical protein [Dysgonomonas alginatilytica]PXV68099.1 hypothetical protein CLV62_102131 [Dysgonomonas alginatilytica]
MIQQRKKDYLQRLIEDFFARLHELIDAKKDLESVSTEKKRLIKECFFLFNNDFNISQEDSAETITIKIGDNDLIEQYAKLLLTKYEISDIKEAYQLHIALDLIEYLEATDKTYSWNRTILKEDILRLLDV